ncbi:MAG: hypothetical protein AAFQ87_10765 [Bacteroidota bacterium]
MKLVLPDSEIFLIQQIWGELPQKVGPESALTERSYVQLDWDTRDSAREFAYICNPDGSIRWLFPKDQAYPVHLALYNSAHWKARAYKLATHLAFKLKQQGRLHSGEIWLGDFQQSELYQMIDEVPHDGLAIFTGTVGENRKAIVAINQGKQTTHFLKVPLGPASRNNVANEAEILNQIASLDLQVLQVPTVKTWPRRDSVLLSNVKPKEGREGNRLSVTHLKALREFYDATRRSAKLGHLPYYREIQQNLLQIGRLEISDQSLDHHQILRIFKALDREYRRLTPDEQITVAWAHGDFTSWNMYQTEEALYVYDWELAQPDMPILYDAFHYLYQTGILLLKQSKRQLEKELLRAQRLPGMGDLLRDYQLSFDSQHRLYLVHLISYYLRIYMDEPSVHMQVQWLLDAWEHALTQLS